jgi:RHS repeat-associated protein
LNWDAFKWRNHQPDIGRFFNIDPLAEKYVYNSPYAFSENHVVAHRELEGLEKVLVTSAEFTAHENGKTIYTGGGAEKYEDKNVYNKKFAEAPNGGEYKEVNAQVESSNGQILSMDNYEHGDGALDFGARTYMPDIGRFSSIDPHADKFEIVTLYNYAFNNPLFFVDPTGKENIIYLIVAGDFSQKKAREIRNQANAILKELGLETRVQVYDAKKNGKFSEKNLDETDNWAVIGNDRGLLAKTASDISGDKDYKAEISDWKNSGGNDPEVSNQEPGKSAKERGIVVDDSQKHNVFKKHTVMGSAVSLLHGAAHSSNEIERIRGLHPTSGISADGSQLRTDYWKYVLPAGGNFHSILNPELNKEFIKGIKERYGTNAAKDNYFKNMVHNSNKNRTKQ